MSITIIYGPMFAGKTTTLINLINENKKSNHLVIKHSLDNRYSDNSEELITHDKIKTKATLYKNLLDISIDLTNITNIFIDEAQFFNDLLEFCKVQKTNGKHLFIAGLNKDINKNSFGYIDQLIRLGLVDKEYKLYAVCECGEKAEHTIRKINNNTQILIGGSDLYKSVCNNCYNF